MRCGGVRREGLTSHSSPLTPDQEDRQISVCCTALLTQTSTKIEVRVRVPCPPHTEKGLVVQR